MIMVIQKFLNGLKISNKIKLFPNKCEPTIYIIINEYYSRIKYKS